MLSLPYLGTAAAVAFGSLGYCRSQRGETLEIVYYLRLHFVTEFAAAATTYFVTEDQP